MQLPEGLSLKPIETLDPRTLKEGECVLAWCDHDANPYFESEDGSRLTTYGAHAEGMGHADDGWNLIDWGGAWDDRTYEEPSAGWCPDWRFVRGRIW